MQMKSIVKEGVSMKEQKKSDQPSEPQREPLFTGDYRRDTSVSEWEKAAEVSFAIREALTKIKTRDKN